MTELSASIASRDKMRRIGIALLVLLLLAALLAGGRLRSQVRALYHSGRNFLAGAPAQSDLPFGNIIFLHHSTGANLIKQGKVRQTLSANGYSFWDHGYNDMGLKDPDGVRTGYSYNIPQDNTDPDGYARLFAQRPYQQPLNAFSRILQHDVIIFKSCFPTSNIADLAQLAAYQDYYLQIRETADRHPDKLFIAVTPPPLDPSATTPENAARARAFAAWLASPEYLQGHANMHVFDFFDLLAEDDPDAADYNTLRAAYRPGGGDSHPNKLANETIGPLFAQSILDAIASYQTSP